MLRDHWCTDIEITTWLHPARYDQRSLEWLKTDQWRQVFDSLDVSVLDTSGWQSDRHAVKIRFVLKVGEGLEEVCRTQGRLVRSLVEQIEPENLADWLREYGHLYSHYLTKKAA